MAGDAAQRAFLAKALRDLPLQRVAGTQRRHALGKPRHLGVVAGFLVAANAGFVLHALERGDVAAFAIVVEIMVLERQFAAGPGRVHHHLPRGLAVGINLHRRAHHVAGDRHREQQQQDRARKHPAHRALARQHAGEREAAQRVALAFVSGDLADGDRDIAVAFARHCQARRAQRNLAAGARIDGAFGDHPPVEPEAQRAERRDAQRPVRLRGDAHMVLLDREIGQVDVVFRSAADGEGGLLDHAVADQLAPGGGEIDGADQECHSQPLTSRRTQI